MPIGEKQSHRFGPFELDTQCGQLRKDGVGLKLQGQPLQILEILLEKPGELVTREELRARLWTSDTFVDFDHSLNTAIKKLRQALGDEADTHRYIETLPKRGYRFIGEVAAEENPHASSAIDQPAGEDLVSKVTTTLVDAVLDAAESKRKARRNFWLVTSSAGLLALAAAAAYFVVKPEPMPRIVGSHVLTKTGYPKGGNIPLVDRGSLYFVELRPSGVVYQRVPVTGGEASSVLRPNVFLRDISRDGSGMLWAVDTDRASWKADTWVQPLPDGTPRLIVKDARWAIWSADGRSIFFTRNRDTELYRANVDGTGVERLATAPAFSNPHLSPDGTRIRFTERDAPFRLWEIGTDGRNLHQLLLGRKDVYGGSWSPDGRYYFFSSWDGDRWILSSVSEAHPWWKKAEASQPWPLTFGPTSVGAPAISKDGKQLYAIGTERSGELSVYDSKAGKFAPYLGGQSICYVDFSRDGQWMAYVSYPEGTLWRSRIDGSERRQLTVPPLAVMNPRWSPDGKMIAFTDLSNGDRRQMNDDTSRRVYVISADGGAPELLLAGRFEDPSWSPDGRSIVYAYRTTSPTHEGSDVRILDLQTQKSITVPGSQDMWAPRWSPDGKYLAALLRWPPRKLMLFSFARGSWEELASGEQLGWHSWSHDSKFLYAQDGESLVRISIVDHRKEQITSLQGFRGTAYYMDKWNQGWFGLTSDDRPLTTRDTGIQELYAFDLEYK